ncbi:homoserine/homoserine lactone efflux protein [Vibrio azureus]|uniref:Homoserine/homoserine lactone efflux protein n=1 Tax=Vibrio azureus NBRC 104587 TaxID=1219077 RepID=U3AVV0_9VIBR|nr:homoserine/homoserine lactone efflux protein [Vibrio azureus]AUI87282.1 homoserine/homoserine lactone efflux protein [Vibrio azureus]GAD77875.1 homoserine/homoserine lactone efflux protein [Vibrio azureus NBRC 104587]
MDTHVWLAYLATAIIFSLAPGSGMVNSVSNGLAYGMRRSLSAIVGLQIGLAIHILLVGAGIGVLVAQSATLFNILKWLGAAYLLWLGIQKWRTSSTLESVQIEKSVSSRALFYKAILINLTNPKSIVFLVALFPQFIDPYTNQMTQLLILGFTTVIIDGVVMLGYTFLASQIGGVVRSEKIMSRMNKVFGSMFIGCGALLASAKY